MDVIGHICLGIFVSLILLSASKVYEGWKKDKEYEAYLLNRKKEKEHEQMLELERKQQQEQWQRRTESIGIGGGKFPYYTITVPNNKLRR